MKPELNKLRARIRQCEEFILLCQRIKKLEKLQDGSLQKKKLNIENTRLEILTQLQELSGQLQYLETSMRNRQGLMGTDEEEQWKGQIKTARIRMATLKQSADSASEQIERIDRDLAESTKELEDSYHRLEQSMVEGLDPNTIEETLAELRREKASLTEAIKADVSSCHTTGQKQPDKRRLPPEGTPVHESEFYDLLLLDLARAKTSVEIVSPNLAGPRSSAIIAELAQLVSMGRSVTIYTSPINEQDPSMQSDLQKVIIDAHRLLITIVQRTGLAYNAAIIDNVICWEGTIAILGTSQPHDTMRRTSTSLHVRELRQFIFNNPSKFR